MITHAIYPQTFDVKADGVYLADPAARRLADFFHAKGLAALKDEDRNEKWYDDWLAYQAQHHLYASLLSPKSLSCNGAELNLLRLTRFLEVFGYFSPAHGYSLQVSFLGFFSILMGSNAALKQEAVTALEAGGLFAFGVSEKEHGSDLLGGEFRVESNGDGMLKANGTKYYIGNCRDAAMITILARKEDPNGRARGRRAPMMLITLRPAKSPGIRNVRKTRTIGVRAAFVGEFEVHDQEFPQTDVIAEGRDAWDAVFGTVTLGKFFLGFGAIGICERAFAEATDHLRRRVLFGKPVIEMPHIKSLVAEAYARLTAMKLYAYRALDYVNAAGADDRRYLLYTAVQKAKVSTQGVKVVSILSECIGAKAFESDTYFEMALRDILLVPSLEGSTHINFGMAAQFIPRYLSGEKVERPDPKSLVGNGAVAGENPYLMEARTSPVNTVQFAHFLKGYLPLIAIANVRRFARQTKAFQLFLRRDSFAPVPGDTQRGQLQAQCFAIIAYAQLVAENATLLNVAPQLISTIYHQLILDFATAASALAACDPDNAANDALIRRSCIVPRTSADDWEVTAAQFTQPQ